MLVLTSVVCSKSATITGPAGLEVSTAFANTAAQRMRSKNLGRTHCPDVHARSIATIAYEQLRCTVPPGAPRGGAVQKCPDTELALQLQMACSQFIVVCWLAVVWRV